MRIFDPKTGKSYFQKHLQRYDGVGQARGLTFSCYRGFRFLEHDRTRQWFLEALQAARCKWPFDLWAYVLMPEHVHLLICPRTADVSVASILSAVKEPVARKAIEHIMLFAPKWLPRITVHEGNRVRRRFWQPGGGYDRNIVELPTARRVIDYIHANPVRRGLVERPEDWEWSSARWYAGLRPVSLEMDRSLPDELGSTPAV